MMKQGLMFNDILLKKFKILRTGILLGNVRNREDTLMEYEETAKEVDNIHTKIYEELLGSKLYTTTTLEEEKDNQKLIRLLDELKFEFTMFQKIVSEYCKKDDCAGLYEFLKERNYLW